jgi:hypothetical protein
VADQTITFNFQGSGNQLVSETKKIGQELEQIEQKSKGFGSSSAKANQDAAKATADNARSTTAAGFSVTELASKYFLVLQALQAVMSVGKAAYGSLIQQNVELQQQLVGTEAALASTNKVFSGGIEIQDPTAAIQALEGPVNGAIARIRAGSLDLVGVTSQDLIPIFQNIAGQSSQIGANLDQSADLTVKFAAALGTFNIPLAQQRQEVSSILQGNITMDSVLAKNLNITNDMVRSWKANGTVVEELNKRLAASAAANKLNAETVTGYASNIKEIFDNVTLASGKGLTQELTLELGKIFNYLKDNQAQIEAFVTRGTDAILSLIGGIKDVGGSILGDGKPAFEQFGGALENAGGLIESLLLGFGNILKLGGQILGSPLVTWPLELVKNATFALQAIASLNGQFAQGTIAADIYRQQSAKVADEALSALTKTKNGEADAAQARKNAIASIETQLKALQESNVVGTENRDVIRTQINELEGLKGKLTGAAGNIKLVSKDTTQLTSDLKRLGEQFDAQGKSAELATAQLTAATKRARAANANEGGISAREEQVQLYQIEQEGLNARLKLAQDKAAGIAAIAAKGGDSEQKKEFAKQLIAAQLEAANLEGTIAEKSLARKKAIQDLQLKDLETYQAKAADAIAASETALQTETENRYQKDLTQKQRYEIEKLAIAQTRIENEIQAEQERTKALQKLTFTDPDEAEANEAKIRTSKQKTASLTLSALQNQRAIEQGIAEIAIKGINDRAAAVKRSFDDRKLQYESEKNDLEDIANSLERQTKLREAQTNLAKAQAALTETGAGIETAALDRALELRKKLNDETTSPAVRRVLQQQLEALTGSRNANEVTILQRKFAIEDAMAKLKALSLLKEQEAARQALAVELQRNELAAKRAIIEARIAEINTKTALSEAKKNLADLQKTPGADPSALADAAQAVKEAQQNVGLATGNVQNAQENLSAQKPLAALSERTLAAQQLQALAQQQAAEYARQQAEQLTIVEAKSKAIAAGDQRVGFTNKDFEKIAPPKIQFGTEFNQSIGRDASATLSTSRALPIRADLSPIPTGLSVPSAPNAQATDAQLGPLRQLVAIAQKQQIQTETLNAQLLRLANRPANQVTVNQPLQQRSKILSGSGL